MAEFKFKIGDVVQLKTKTGPDMVVQAIQEYPLKKGLIAAHCRWFDSKDATKSYAEWFDENLLVLKGN